MACTARKAAIAPVKLTARLRRDTGMGRNATAPMSGRIFIEAISSFVGVVPSGGSSRGQKAGGGIRRWGKHPSAGC
jgi:hypothetical protein